MEPVKLDVRGVDDWQVRKYLEGFGGRLQQDGSYVGPGWSVTLDVGEHKAFTTMVPRVVMTIDGDGAAVAHLADKLRLYCFRCGG